MKPTKFGSDKNPFAKAKKMAAGGAATSSFGKAFAAARKRGDKEFTFEGRGKNTRFTTETVEEQAARKAKKTSGPTPNDTKLNTLVAAEKNSNVAPDRGSILMRGSDTGPMARGYKLPAKAPTSAPASQPAASKPTATATAPNPADRSYEAQSRRAGMAAASSKKAPTTAKKPAPRVVAPPAPVDEDTQAAIDRFTAGRGSVSPLRGNANPGVSPGYAKGGGIERKGKTKAAMPKMAKGGSIDGIAMRGKTRGCK
jgi:hypothetical protein